MLRQTKCAARPRTRSGGKITVRDAVVTVDIDTTDEESEAAAPPSPSDAATPPRKKRAARVAAPASPPAKRARLLTVDVSAADAADRDAVISVAPATAAANLPRRPHDSAQVACDAASVLALQQSLHVSAEPAALECREGELAAVRGFVEERVAGGDGGALYVCGSPGTGKSATLAAVRRWAASEPAVSRACTVTHVNAMALARPGSGGFLCGLLAAVTRRRAAADEAAAAEGLARLFAAGAAGRMRLVVVDEIDHLGEGARGPLARLLRWACAPSSRLVLVGVANTMGLPERVAPSLGGGLARAPQTVVFSPYSPTELARVLKRRLLCGAGVEDAPGADGMLPPLPFFAESAVELCARKVASGSGDVRRGLDVLRECLDRALRSASGGGGGADGRELRLDVVGARAISRVLAEGLGSHHVRQIQALPRLQQVVLCAAVIAVRRRDAAGASAGEVTPGQLRELYSAMASNDRLGLPRMMRAEFLEVLTALSSAGLVAVRGGSPRDFWARGVTLAAQDDDVDIALGGDPFFGDLLEQGARVRVAAKPGAGGAR